MKKVKRILLLILCILIIGSALPLTSLAAKKPYYLVLGDSIGYGSGIMNSSSACYGKIIADTNGFDYANEAIPGNTTENLMDRLEKPAVVEKVKKADIISISIGGNDFLMSNILGLLYDSMILEDYREFEKIGEAYYKKLCSVISTIKAFNGDAVILMQTLYNPQSGNVRPTYQVGVNQINKAIRRYDKNFPGKIEIVDVEKALGANMANYATDGIHPSAIGNENIARAVQAKLVELGLATKKEIVIREKGIDIIDYGLGGFVRFVANIYYFFSKIF